jgi:hypothetical protein
MASETTMETIKCRICGTINDEDNYFCIDCGAMLADNDELDLSPSAPLDVIFRKTSKFYNRD